MERQTGVIKDASRWGVLREFRPVLERFADMAEADATAPTMRPQFESLFAQYFARLGAEAARQDRPECRIYRRLAQVAMPTVFIGEESRKSESHLALLDSPGKQARNPLYTLARETQNLSPGTFYLKDATSLFASYELSPNMTPAILEYSMETSSLSKIIKARIPLILTGTPGASGFVNENLPTIERIFNVMNGLEDTITIEVFHLPYLKSKEKELIKLSESHALLDWVSALPGSRVESPIVAAFLGDPRLNEDHTTLGFIKIASGSYSKLWPAASKGLFGSLLPSSEVWKYWSFKNAMYQARNVNLGNMVRDASTLSSDILKLPGVQFDKDRTATMAVHVPILTAAAYTQVASKGIEDALVARAFRQAEADANAREAESRSWDTFYYE